MCLVWGTSLLRYKNRGSKRLFIIFAGEVSVIRGKVPIRIHFNCLVRWKVTGGKLFAQHLITTFGIYSVIS